jgi:hypothetical protein
MPCGPRELPECEWSYRAPTGAPLIQLLPSTTMVASKSPLALTGRLVPSSPLSCSLSHAPGGSSAGRPVKCSVRGRQPSVRSFGAWGQLFVPGLCGGECTDTSRIALNPRLSPQEGRLRVDFLTPSRRLVDLWAGFRA